MGKIRENSLFVAEEDVNILDYSLDETHLRVSNAMTFEAWVRPNDIDGGSFLSQKNNTIARKWDDVEGRRTWYLCLFNDGTKVVRFAAVYDSGRQDINFSYQVVEGVWTHLAIVFEAPYLRLYTNGTLYEEVTTGDSLLETDGTFSLTNDTNAEQVQRWCYTGEISEARYWNIARTESEIQDNMNKEVDPNSVGLVGYWKLDEGTGSTVNDSTPYGHNLLIGGTGSWNWTTETPGIELLTTLISAELLDGFIRLDWTDLSE